MRIAGCDTGASRCSHASVSGGTSRSEFTFADIFAGIGGFRIGLERLGGRCVFSCERDIFCRKTYEHWFGEIPSCDIRDVKPGEIPDHDLLTAGFPCQPFSMGGLSTKRRLGQPHGFEDKNQGSLFFRLTSILRTKRPQAFIFENVRNLLFHDRARTWKRIERTLSRLGYAVFRQVIDARAWVPQHRERLFIVGFDRRRFGKKPVFEFPRPPPGPYPQLRDILSPEARDECVLTDGTWTWLRNHARRHSLKGNGFGYSIADPEGQSRTLSARYHKDGSEILIGRGRNRNPRRLTPRECARLMGFDDSLQIVVSNTQAWRQFGNAVVPAVVEAVGRDVLEALRHDSFARDAI